MTAQTADIHSVQGIIDVGEIGVVSTDENVDNVGLFGYMDYDAKVQNVGVVDSYIRGAGTVGGVVGLNAGGTISNVYNTGAVSGLGEVGGLRSRGKI